MQKSEAREAIISRLVTLFREAREKKGLSLNEVAWRTGLSHTTIMRFERGTTIPNIDTLLRMSDALGADLSAMLKKAGTE